ILNSEKMYFTLPRSESRGIPVLIKRLGGLFKKLPDAAIALTPEIESDILDGFLELTRNRGQDWLCQWLEFQLLNPIVSRRHYFRVGGEQKGWLGKRVISDDGREIWEEHQLIMEKAP